MANDEGTAVVDVAGMRNHIADLYIERDAALAPIAALKEALLPFVKIAEQLQKHLPDDHKNTLAWACPTAGDFRRDRSTYEGKT